MTETCVSAEDWMVKMFELIVAKGGLEIVCRERKDESWLDVYCPSNQMGNDHVPEQDKKMFVRQ